MRLASSIDKNSFALTIRIPIRVLHLGIAFVQDRDDPGIRKPRLFMTLPGMTRRI